MEPREDHRLTLRDKEVKIMIKLIGQIGSGRSIRGVIALAVG